VDYLQNEETVEPGEWFYTSGDDLLFPRGLPVGPVKTVAAGRTFKEVLVEPSGLGGGVEEVLIVLQGVHQPVPEPQAAVDPAPLLPPPPAEGGGAPAAAPVTAVAAPDTDADGFVETYRKSAAESGRPYGDNVQAVKPPATPGAAAVPASRPPGAAPPKPAAGTGTNRP
jgi:rod shape-determining protein MreC